MIRIQDISHSYFVKKAETITLKNINLSVNPGELFGLIGPDGAGKTTLIRILATLLVPTAGNAFVSGYNTQEDFKSIRKIVGYMPGKFSLYMDLTIEENLNFFATIFNTSLEENYNLIKDIYVQIEPFKNRRAGKLSGGMKQKLALCCALIHKPKVLFLDEPTTGVDAVSRVEFWQMLQGLRKQGITVFVSTPYMDEASMCDRIALIQEGEILNIDSPKNIIASFSNTLLEVKGKDMLMLLKYLKSIPHTQDVYAFGEYHHVVVKADAYEAQWRLDAKQKFGDIEINKAVANVEDCFIYYLKNKEQTLA